MQHIIRLMNLIATNYAIIVRVNQLLPLVNVPHPLIVDVIEELVLVVPIVVLEELDPALQIGQDPPRSRPLLPHDSAHRDLIVYYQEQLVLLLVVLRDQVVVLEEGGLVEQLS